MEREGKREAYKHCASADDVTKTVCSVVSIRVGNVCYLIPSTCVQR